MNIFSLNNISIFVESVDVFLIHENYIQIDLQPRG